MKKSIITAFIIIFVFASGLLLAQDDSKPVLAVDMKDAEYIAKKDAQRQIIQNINSMWMCAVSKKTTEKSELAAVKMLDETDLTDVEFGTPSSDESKGLVTLEASISRTNIIKSIKNTEVTLTQKVYDELKYSILPESMTVVGKGAWKKQAHGDLLAFYEAEASARRNLLDELKSIMCQFSTRLEGYAINRSDVMVAAEKNLLMAAKKVKEEVQNGEAVVEIEIEKDTIIYSIRKGLEERGLKITQDEYKKKYILDTPVYSFEGKATLPIFEAPIPIEGGPKVSASSYLLAEEAAKKDAMQQLAERIYGIMIQSFSEFKDFQLKRDLVIATLKPSFLLGVQYDKPVRRGNEVYVKATIARSFIIKGIQEVYKKNSLDLDSDDLKRAIKEKYYNAEGIGFVK